MARDYRPQDERQTSGSREERQAQLQARAADVQRGRDEAWHYVGAAGEPAFESSWVNYGGGYANTRFKRINGVVFVQIAVANGALGPVFTLPAGYRPNGTVMMPYTREGASDGIIYVDVFASGLVNFNMLGTNVGNFASFCFPADQ